MNARATAAVRLLAGDKEPVRLASTANLALAGLLTVDGVVTVAGDRVLVKDQSNATANGIYTASVGAWQRSPDASSSRTLIAGMMVYVQEGSTQASNVWVLATDRPDLGTDSISFTLYISTDIIASATAAAAAASASQSDAAASASDAAASSAAAVAAAAVLSPTVLAGYLSGLELVNVGTSSSIDIGAGAANDVAFGGMMALAATIRKTTSSWAVGNAAGGLDTGAIATSTWYHFFLIKRVDTGVVDVLFSLSATAPTMPTNYTLKRRIGSAKTTGSSQWTLFFQRGDAFIWDVPVQDQASVALSTTSALYSLTVPPGPTVMAHFISYYNSSLVDSYILISSGLPSVQAANSPTANREQQTIVANKPVIARQSILTNGSAQIRAVGNGVGATEWYVVTHGWTDRRGK